MNNYCRKLSIERIIRVPLVRHKPLAQTSAVTSAGTRRRAALVHKVAGGHVANRGSESWRRSNMKPVSFMPRRYLL